MSDWKAFAAMDCITLSKYGTATQAYLVDGSDEIWEVTHRPNMIYQTSGGAQSFDSNRLGVYRATAYGTFSGGLG